MQAYRIISILSAALASLALIKSASGQFVVDWHTVDGGGAMFSTDGQPNGFELSGTIGQPDAGVMTGGSFELTGGFWAVTAPSGTGTPAATVTAAASRKTHLIHGVQDLPINVAGEVQSGNVTSEARNNGLTELRVAFDTAPGGPGSDPVMILEQACPACTPACNPPGSQGSYVPYSGSAAMTATVQGNDLVLTFIPGLESPRTYRLDINAGVTSIAGQSVELRVMLGDINSDARTNGGDRSQVVGVWTSTGFSAATDISLDGKTNGTDRSIIVGVWTSAQRCAP